MPAVIARSLHVCMFIALQLASTQKLNLNSMGKDESVLLLCTYNISERMLICAELLQK